MRSCIFTFCIEGYLHLLTHFDRRVFKTKNFDNTDMLNNFQTISLVNPPISLFETHWDVCSFFLESQNSIAVNCVFNYLLVFKRFLVKECTYIHKCNQGKNMDRNHSRTIRIVERHFHRNKKETWFPLKLVTKPLSFHTFLPLKVSLKSSINSGKRNFSPHFTSVERTNIYKLGRRILFNFYDWIFPFIEWKINCSILILVNNCKHKNWLQITTYKSKPNLDTLTVQ